jgi:hypothetical protein
MQAIYFSLVDFSPCLFLYISREHHSVCAPVAHALPGRDVRVNPAGRIVLEPGASFFLLPLFSGLGGRLWDVLSWPPSLVYQPTKGIDLSQSFNYTFFVIICEQKIPRLFEMDKKDTTKPKNKRITHLFLIYIVNLSRLCFSLFLVHGSKSLHKAKYRKTESFLFGCAIGEPFCRVSRFYGEKKFNRVGAFSRTTFAFFSSSPPSPLCP